ncbi:MAG: hypothetical protein GX660_26635 [Clostridiaceae bacterium]|nr:hypothetical protein [Clostridiaceae bacterium]
MGEDNSYGHPDNLILNRLKTFGIEVFRTDKSGTIIATSDGETIKLDKKASAIKENAPPTPAPRDIEIQTTTVVNVTPTTTPEPIPTISPTPEQIKSENALPQVVYIGNKNTKKFHRSSCSSLPYPKNQVIFNSREEAINAGYEACKRCNP